MSARTRNRRGVTLVELLVVLVILGLAATVTSLNIRLGRERPAANDRESIIGSAQEEAARTGQPVTRALERSEAVITALPNGEVIVAPGVLAESSSARVLNDAR